MDEATYTSVADVLAAYQHGVRVFEDVRIEQADFRGRDLQGAAFHESSFRGATFERAQLHRAQFVGCDLTRASLEGAVLSRARIEETALLDARMAGARLVGVMLDAADARGVDLTGCRLTLAHLVDTDLTGAIADDITLGGSTLSDVDLSPFCDAARSLHVGPSFVDFRSVLRSYHHPGLKRFLVDCGVPPLVAEYTIAAAEAEGDALGSLMRSTFISYGGPDEAFARRLYEELRAHGVTTFFFPETARLGRRIGDEVHSRIQEHDRVILVCSRASLDRPGVRNEIQETFDREARDGGATYLIPIRLDDYVLDGWDDPLAPRVRDRVVGDFSGAAADDKAFDRAMTRLLAELRKEPR